MAHNLDIQLLRHFVVVAEELHFTKAAARLYIAQQVLSRDIKALEAAAGVRLLNRTTRRVELSPAGQLLWERATELIALHDATAAELRGTLASLVVDVVGAGLTPARVLDAAREAAPDIEFFARFNAGGQNSDLSLASATIDVAFGRASSSGPPVRSELLRYEQFAVLLPASHELAAWKSVPLELLRHSGVCFRAGDQATPAWEDAALQLLAPLGIDRTAAHPHVLGAADLQHHLRQRNAPILTLLDQPPVEGAVRRPVVDPVALYPWSMSWRADAVHPGIPVLRAAARRLAEQYRWLDRAEGAWLPS